MVSSEQSRDAHKAVTEQTHKADTQTHRAVTCHLTAKFLPPEVPRRYIYGGTPQVYICTSTSRGPAASKPCLGIY